MKYRMDIKSVVLLLVIINMVVFFLTRVIYIPVPDNLLNSLVYKGKTIAAFSMQRYGLFTALFSLFPVLIKDLGWAWQVFTYMFLHGSFLHIFFNMYALFLFGRPLEERWGTREFTLFYFFTGIGAGIVTFFWNLWTIFGNPNIPTIGASGAIFGIVLAFGLEFPDTILLLFFLIPVRARYAALIFGGIELIMILTGRIGGIAHLTHLAGLLFGYVYYIMRIKKRYGRRTITSQRKMKLTIPKLKFAVSEEKKDKAAQKANLIKKKIRSGNVLSHSERLFLSKLKDAYYNESAQLCDFDEFSPELSVCQDCDSFYACLYRFILKDR
ncbi:MAG: rhomboid family intramembrane serine protease [Spirochaetota bacterium]|nr:MAG: rhomboid family intramembrane serine protease [Spirochaetota bacterium]